MSCFLFTLLSPFLLKFSQVSSKSEKVKLLKISAWIKLAKKSSVLHGIEMVGHCKGIGYVEAGIMTDMSYLRVLKSSNLREARALSHHLCFHFTL